MRRVRAISAFCFRIWSTCFPAGDRSRRSAPSKARSMSGSRSRFASMQSFLTASVIALTWKSRTADLLLLLAHRREELLLALGHLLRRHVLLVRGEAPPVAGRILHLAVAVAPEHVGEGHDDLRAGLHRPLERLVDVGHVDVQVTGGPAHRSRRPASHARLLIAQHEDGVADLELGVHEGLAVGPGYAHQLLGAQGALVEVDRLGPVTDGERGGDRAEPVRDWLRHRTLPL